MEIQQVGTYVKMELFFGECNKSGDKGRRKGTIQLLMMSRKEVIKRDAWERVKWKHMFGSQVLDLSQQKTKNQTSQQNE